MPASYSAAFPQSPDSGTEQFVRFTFPVTWSFLSRDPSAHKTEPKPELKHARTTELTHDPSPAVDRPRGTVNEPGSPRKPAEKAEIVAPVRAADAKSAPASRPTEQVSEHSNIESTAIQRSPVDRPPADRAHGDRWEMVIPKMSRPVSWSSRKLISGAPRASESSGVAPQKEAPSRPPEPRAASHFSQAQPAAATAPAAQNVFSAPEFGQIRQKPSSDRKFVIIGVSSLTVMLVAAVLFLSLERDTSGAKDSAPVAVTAGAPLVTGAVQWTPLAESPRRLSIVRGSAALTDFRMTFQIPAAAKAVGWIVRAGDSRNYFAIRLEITNSPGGSSSALLKRFAVIDGIDQPVMRFPVALAIQPGSMYKVRTEAVGNKFTTWIADRKIDEWTDARLASGGVGVFNERGESSVALNNLAVFPLLRK